MDSKSVLTKIAEEAKVDAKIAKRVLISLSKILQDNSLADSSEKLKLINLSIAPKAPKDGKLAYKLVIRGRKEDLDLKA
jgi:hypothetical protein